MRKPDKQEKKRLPNGRFAPGVSGNPQGRPKSKTLSEAYRAALMMPLPDDPTRTYADVIAEQLCKQAHAGDVGAARELADRTEGKPRQAIDLDVATDWRELARANGLSEDEVVREFRETLRALESAGASDDTSSDDEAYVH